MLIPSEEFERAGDDLGLIADMCRANALVAVKRAGSGHLGSSFSALDIVVHLLWRELNVAELGWDHPDRDVFFSSKGHDVPGLYAALHALGVIPTDRLLRLRRLGGLDGHPDVGIPGIEANSGSLGMGLSKGRGLAWGKRFNGQGGRVLVMTGDGELQEGQNWEAFASAVHQGVGNLWAIVDRNELQSDRPTEEILALGDLEGEPESGAGLRRVTDEYVAAAYGDELLRLVREHPEVVVLDADLASDCRIRAVELEEPSRFVEIGIAEQDMVSMAAGLAREGLLPVVNSFASFLASRANEQIYNQASEGTKVVYALHYAGLIPAGPGKSHQSIRDVSLLGALPGMTIVQPANADETKALLRWAVAEAPGSVALRLAIGPSPRRIELADVAARVGVGHVLVDGDGPPLLAYGPVMLREALVGAETPARRGVRPRLSPMPWL